MRNLITIQSMPQYKAILHSTTKTVVLFFAMLFVALAPISAQTVVTVTSSGSWTVPAGVTTATVYLWGGGGGGGGGTNSGTNFGNGGGGGGGACASATIVGLIAGNTYTCTLGAGGTGGSAANGGAGGTTTFTGVAGTWTAGGGAGGLVSNGGGGAHAGGAGSAVGTGAGVSVRSGATGSAGNDGVSNSTGITGTGGGGGGSTSAAVNPASTCGSVGTGGAGTYAGGLGGKTACVNGGSAVGPPGAQPGGGGGGPNCWGTTFGGGAGGTGQVTIVYTIPAPTITSFNPASGCSNNLPLVTITGTNLTGTTAVSFNGTAAASFTNVSATTVTATPAVGTTTGVITLTTLGGTVNSAGNFTVNAAPVAAINPAAPLICGVGSATLTASGGGTYAWNTGAATAAITVSPIITTTYTVTVTTPATGCTASTTKTVTVGTNPIPTVNNATVCAGSPATLTGTGGVSYVWNTGAVTTSITVSPVVNTTYTVTATNAAGCTAAASGTVTVKAVPTPSVNNATICAGGSATLTASGGLTYSWSTGSVLPSITVSPASTTTYTVTATNALACTASVSGTVTVNALPTPTVNSPSMCAGTSATLTATGGVSYAWNTGAVSTSITVSPVSTTTYTVTATNAAGCTAAVNGTVTVNANPTPTVNSPGVCLGSSATLTATGGTSYAWSTGGATASIVVSPVVNTTYNVTVTNAAGCTASINSNVTVNPVPTVSANSNSPIAIGATLNLTSSPAGGSSPYTYSWSGPSAYASVLQNPSIPAMTAAKLGTYTITVTDLNTCTATASTVVTSIAPGGTITNLKLWLKANAGVAVVGPNVTSWADQSGGANNATTVNATNPTLVNNSVNAYPIVNFAGAGGLQGAFGSNVTANNLSAFIVSQTAVASANPSGMFSISAGGTNDGTTVANAAIFQKSGATITTTRNSANRGNYSGANAFGQYHLFTSEFSGANSLFFNEGVAANNTAYAAAAFNSSLYTIGSRFTGAASNYLTGQIAEVVLYDRLVTAAEKNQIESYLALKYGMTLDQTAAQNYTSSTGAVIWNAATNGTYKNNIFGVGIDNGSALSQTGSVSINIAQLSISSAVSLTNNSFMIVSDNASANTLSYVAGLPNSLLYTSALQWRVSQSGTRSNANFNYNIATNPVTGYFAPIATVLVPYMLVDSNADGVWDQSITASSNVTTTYTFNAFLKDGAIFTYGYKPQIDFGDAPNVATNMAANGAGHLITAGVYLGALIDAEPDAIVSYNTVGDDTVGLADEDGVDFNIGVVTGGQNIVQIGIANSVKITASTSGYINAWIDLNQDGTFGGGSEYAMINVPVVAGVNVVSFTLSDSIEYGGTVMRFRFAKNIGDVTAPTGLATNGEVEDYKVYVTAPVVGACTNGFQNPDFENGLTPGTYIITSETNFPYWRTTASDKMLEVWQSGFNGVPAYSGSYFVELNANLPGALYQDVYTIPGTPMVWHFAHRGRSGVDSCNLKIGPPGATVTKKIVGDGTAAWGVYTGVYIVPAGQYITRFEFNALFSVGGLSYGNFIDDMSVSSSFDYGDAPLSYSTVKASNGPSHAIISTLHLGANVSCESDGQPGAAASLDAFDDGVTFPAVCSNCNTYTANISFFNNTGLPATIAGWVDLNRSGTFDVGERVRVNVGSSALQQSTTLTWTILPSMISVSAAPVYARFRIANDSTEIIIATGLATSGEVEDYKVDCALLAIPVATNNGPICTRTSVNLSSSLTGVFQTWRGPTGFAVNGQNVSRSNVQLADSGNYRVYAIYANGCETDSPTLVHVNDCFVNIAGSVFDDANGNGVVDGADVATSLGQSLYAVLVDTTGLVLATSTVAANGSFSIVNAPAYMTGMTVTAQTSNPTVGVASGGPSWPSRWVGTLGRYGTNNLAGAGTYTNTDQMVKVYTGIVNVTNLMLGYDRVPTTTVQTYTIPYPLHNSIKAVTAAFGMGNLAGADAEDGAVSGAFTITSIAQMNGNTLFYDINGNGVIDPAETIIGYTVITSFNPALLKVKFTGLGSTSAKFSYGAVDAATQVDPTPSLYTIKWVGALPVKLISFDAEKASENTTLVKWATATEIDNDHFDIERSLDAEHWTKLGEVKGAGNSTETISYSLVDEQPLAGVNYYRLKQVDFDGKFEYSDIAQVTFGGISVGNITAAVYPNPMSQSGTLTIQLSSADDAITHISVTNSVGQEVHNEEVASLQSYQLEGLAVPTGIYFVNVTTASHRRIINRLIIE